MNPLGLRPLEIAAGMVWDDRRRPRVTAPARVTGSPLEALEAAVLPALRRDPCVVSFSGGRDSSLVLAVAARVARREGLRDPVAFTLEYPGQAESQEREWQERVLTHLALGDWQRREIHGELEVTGPYAQRTLARHGLLWPELSYMFLPALEAAAGGALLTGAEGDSVFGQWRWQRANAMLARRAPVTPRNLSRVAHAYAPYPFKRAWAAVRESTASFHWLRPAARRRLRLERSVELADEPARWDRWLRWLAGQRDIRLMRQSQDLLAAEHEAELHHELLDAGFLDAVAAVGGRAGFADRTAAMRTLFAGVLPDDVLARRDKAHFGPAVWTERTRALAADWDGAGVPLDLVDVDALRREWMAERPDARSLTLLHAAMASRLDGGEDLVEQPVL